MDPAQEVLAVEHAWTEAHLRGDVQTLEAIMAFDYVKIKSDGSLSDKKTTFAAYQPDRRAWDVARGDEYDVRVYGETAVVIGRWTARGHNDGQPFDYAARFLSIYVRRD
ncbi:MAG TPA: nuclear transport factor 2 family protein, partial [Anaerolineales bacterium]|nr:nuclear transport factor 2 family protein [Anaerolineales bacterium]